MPDLPVIAWDVDDVLNDLSAEWLRDYRTNHPDMPEYDELSANPPTQLLAITHAEYLESLDCFREVHYPQLQPASSVLEWFQTHGACFRHIAVTAVPRRFASSSARWVLLHFGDWIRTFHFVPSARNDDNSPVYDESKADYLNTLERVDFFVDDSERNVCLVEAIGIKGLVFPQPWNCNREFSIPQCLREITGED